MKLLPWLGPAWQGLASRREDSPHALLVHGPVGIGKLEFARALAQAVLCESGSGPYPCGACEACRWFSASQHPDFRQVEPEALAPQVEPAEDAVRPSKTAKPSQEIKVDQIRELATFLNVMSHRGKRRIALIRPAETMNQNAANALLKALEEPSPGACFILVTNSYERLLPTIRSRCVKVPLALPSPEVARAWLIGQGVEDAALWLSFAGGAPLLAQELSQSARGERIQQLVGLLAAGDFETLASWPATDRDDLELVSEVVQKWAYDQAARASGGMPLYFNGIALNPEPRSAPAWLAFARRAGAFRRSSRHPLNPKLFMADLASAVPRGE